MTLKHSIIENAVGLCLHYFPNYGLMVKTLYFGRYNHCIEFALILTQVTTSFDHGNCTDIFKGTSPATAIIAGVIALVLQEKYLFLGLAEPIFIYQNKSRNTKNNLQRLTIWSQLGSY